MGSLSGMLHRPLSAMAAVAVAAVSIDFYPKSADSSFLETTSHGPIPDSSTKESADSWVSRISLSNLSRRVDGKHSNFSGLPNSLFSSGSSQPIASPPVLLTLYQYAKIAKPQQPSEATASSGLSSTSDVMYRWHLPEPNTWGVSRQSSCSEAKSQTVVVLLGWLGAKQRHLKRYADWYTSRGFHVVTFTFPMADILSYKVGGKTEQNLDLLADHLAGWVSEEEGKKNLVFHTFSNTGWLTYGAILEKFQNQDPNLMGRIKGCIVDSAPVAAPDPQVWASGFSAAFLKKQSVATKGSLNSNDSSMEVSVGSISSLEPKPAVSEVALLAFLEKFFGVVLNLPSVNRRLSDVLEVLSSEQPKCPQLYFYSSADRVIPAKSVESFIEAQRSAGHEVTACNFISSPHVDHFRNHPSLYTSQLTAFLEDHVLTCCKDSSQNEENKEN